MIRFPGDTQWSGNAPTAHKPTACEHCVSIVCRLAAGAGFGSSTFDEPNSDPTPPDWRLKHGCERGRERARRQRPGRDIRDARQRSHRIRRRCAPVPAYDCVGCGAGVELWPTQPAGYRHGDRGCWGRDTYLGRCGVGARADWRWPLRPSAPSCAPDCCLGRLDVRAGTRGEDTQTHAHAHAHAALAPRTHGRPWARSSIDPIRHAITIRCEWMYSCVHSCTF